MNALVKSYINKCAKGNHNAFTISKSIQQYFDLTSDGVAEYKEYIETKLQQKRAKELSQPYYAGRNIRFQ